MAAIDFFIETVASLKVDMAGSGLGFYGASFGTSVAVGEYQDTTYITDTNGVVEGPECRNVKWTHANSGEVAVGPTNLSLLKIPNYQATLNVRFTHSSAVKCQNVEARIYDRNNINVAASGVLTKVAEIIHVDTSQAVTGSGDSAWISAAGSGVTVTMAESPGESGLWAENGTGSTHTDDRHDWFLALSANPTSIGSKTQYGLYVSLEYL